MLPTLSRGFDSHYPLQPSWFSTFLNLFQQFWKYWKISFFTFNSVQWFSMILSGEKPIGQQTKFCWPKKYHFVDQRLWKPNWRNKYRNRFGEWNLHFFTHFFKKWSIGGRKIQMNSVRKCCIVLKINKKWTPTK